MLTDSDVKMKISLRIVETALPPLDAKISIELLKSIISVLFYFVMKASMNRRDDSRCITYAIWATIRRSLKFRSRQSWTLDVVPRERTQLRE